MSIEDQVKIYLGDQVVTNDKFVETENSVFQCCHLKSFCQVDNPGEVVRITPKKGEVDYPGVHAKARPGILERK